MLLVFEQCSGELKARRTISNFGHTHTHSKYIADTYD